MNSLQQKQELVSGHGIIPTFNLGGSINILNLQAPPKEVRLSYETIDFLNNLGASGFEIASVSTSGSPEGISYNELSATNALLQLTVGVIGVIVSNTSPKPPRR